MRIVDIDKLFCDDINAARVYDCMETTELVYDDYKMMCEFTHGISYFQKRDPFTFISSQINTLSILFIYVYLALAAYCAMGSLGELDALASRIFNHFDSLDDTDED